MSQIEAKFVTTDTAFRVESNEGKSESEELLVGGV